MKEATGATHREMWHGVCRDLDGLAIIGGREFEGNNEIQQVQHHGRVQEEGVTKMTITVIKIGS